MPDIDFHSRAWQHGYWVGRGELDAGDADRGGDDASFEDGILTGQAEYGMLFEQGVATKTYAPSFHSVDDLEAGRVSRVAAEPLRASSVYENDTKQTWSSLNKISMRTRNFRIFVRASVAILVVSLVLIIVPPLNGVISVAGPVVGLILFGLLTLVWVTLWVKSRQGEREYLTQPATHWRVTDDHVSASFKGKTLTFPFAEITETAEYGDFILARHPSHRMIVIPLAGMRRSDTGETAYPDDVLAAISTHAHTVPANVMLRAKSPKIQPRPDESVVDGPEQQERKAFNAKYASPPIEIIVLTTSMIGGAGRVGGRSLWTPSAGLLGYIDENGSTVTEKGLLSWLAADGQNNTWVHDLKPLTQYVVQARRFTPHSTEQERRGAFDPKFRHVFALDHVIERGVHIPALDERLARWQQPVSISTDMGHFELDRLFGWFSGRIQWCGRDVAVSLSVDDGVIEGAETCKWALATLAGLVAAMPSVDSRWRAFAAAELADSAEDWRDDGEDGDPSTAPITTDVFVQRIGLSELSIEADGSATPYYDDGDLFGGHVILLDVEPDGTLVDATIAG